MLDAEHCHRILRESFPELDLRGVRYFAQGWDYELWEVNEELLFRFPMREACVAPLQKEIRLLPELADALSVAVPWPEYVSEGCDEFALPFYGYRKLAGVPLSEAALTETQRRDIARELGRFLSQLHRFTIDRAQALDVPCFSAKGWRARYRTFRDRGDREVAPLLSPDERATVAEFWRLFLENDAYFQFSPTLIHGDLDDAHVLVDAKTGQLTGIIDFGDAMVGDPALDFAGFEGAFRAALLGSYELPVDATLERRADVYRQQISPYNAVFYGLEIGDPEWVRRGLDALVKGVLTR